MSELQRVTRRALLFGALATLPSCAGVVFDRPGPYAPRFDHDGQSRLRIAVFELEPLDFLLHTGLIIYTPDDRVLYDPGGFWRDPRATRRLDVTRGFTPELEESYLSRSSLLSSADIWKLHLWETNVPDEVALKAVEIAESRDPIVFGGCAYGVTSLLSALPGFEDMRSTFSRANLILYLQSRDDIRYVSHDMDAASQGA